MSSILREGMSVSLVRTGATGTVRELLGRGGQGEVYRITADGHDDDLALKWYFERVAIPEQRESLLELLDAGSPHPRFLWPIDLVTAADVAGFGYLMPLREPEYVGIVDLVNGTARGVTFRSLVTIAYELAESFLQLHVGGHCYRDINFGNVFFHPRTGSVLICDVDNVGVDEARRFGARGTPRFMAPEVITAGALPSTDTDRYSLAVLLFYVLMVQHPLEGKAALSYDHLDSVEALAELTGRHPVFIFDPDDRSNEPLPDSAALVYWPIYPEMLRSLFVRAFTEGLHDPSRRVTVGEWRSAMARLRDLVVVCQACGKQSFYDPVAEGAGACWSCGVEVTAPPRLRVGHELVMLNADTALYPHHIDGRPFDYATRVAEVAPHPKDRSQWGLRNLSHRAWRATLDGGIVIDIPPGRALPLVDGAEIEFGGAHAARGSIVA